ncbi:hypothetical protein BRI6_2541 [plant metagenome]|uniref:Uncharacterized protein n=1 Tax=plant metagenome TaxID=1297885 RepID=A0A484RRS6_9ZZZZ
MPRCKRASLTLTDHKKNRVKKDENYYRRGWKRDAWPATRQRKPPVNTPS